MRRVEFEPRAWQVLLIVAAVICIAFYALGIVLNEGSQQKLGLARRVPWTSSRVVGFPDPPPPMKLVSAFPNLKIEKLIALDRVPDSKTLIAVDHRTDWGGPSHIVQFLDSESASSTTPFLERPEIIYGLAFHPKFSENRFVYVGCNGQSEKLNEVATRVIRFVVEGDGPYRCVPESARVIIEWKSNGHNGGDLTFGNDGMLYVSAGDGTSDSDTDRNGQNLKTLQGSVLRIDVDHEQDGKLYSIPTNNPFLTIPDARGEIWAFGLRNPWRLSYDRESNQLWAGNNGQDLWESVYLIQRGHNYGWSIRESNHDFHTNQPTGPVDFSPATFEHHHSQSRSLTGGLVYRGKTLPELQGAYVYGDFSTGNIWAIKHNGEQVEWQKLIARSSAQVIGFGEDTHGELLVADHLGGIYKLSRNDAKSSSDFPKLLSETGLFADTSQHEPMDGLISYSVNSPLWSDGTVKQRWMAVPGNETVTFAEKGAWDFPNGTVLVKSFSLPPDNRGITRRIETRLMAKQSGEWYGYSYRWNDEQTDATLVDAAGEDELFQIASDDAQVTEFKWRYPSRSECMVCHSRAAKFVLGLSTEQMNRVHDYAQGQSDYQGTMASQIDTLFHIGLLGKEPQPPKPSNALPRLVSPSDSNADIELRARSYLHSNCSICHIDAGGGNSKIVLDYFTPREKMNLIDAEPLHAKFGLPSPKIIDPGSPENSILLRRISTRTEGNMPPLASHRIDEQAVALIKTWIFSINSDRPSSN